MISGYTPLVYVAFMLVPLLVLFYRRTRLGLYIRVVGEKPEAAEALGISISRIRYTASLLCGLLAGLAGAHLSLGYTTMFTENMSSGRGFMAVAILIFSNGDPLAILLGCLLFGFSDALSLRLQTLGISSYLVLAVPYLVALAALFALSYRARPRLIRETLEDMKPCAGREVGVRFRYETKGYNGTHHSRCRFGRRRHPCCPVCCGVAGPEARRCDDSDRRCRRHRAGHQCRAQHAVAGRSRRHSCRRRRMAADRRQRQGRHGSPGSSRETSDRALRRPAPRISTRRRRNRPATRSPSTLSTSSWTRRALRRARSRW